MVECRSESAETSMRIISLFVIGVGTLLFAVPLTVSSAVMSSGSYQIRQDSVNVGGVNSESASYVTEDTIGEIATGLSASAAYNLAAAGYQQMNAVADAEAASNSNTASNGQPSGQLSPNPNATAIFDGSVIVVRDQARENAALFQWKTTVPVSAVIEWGESISYELGRKDISRNTAQNNGIFSYLYREVAQEFQPGKRYFYRVTVKDENGRVAGYQGTYDAPLTLLRTLPENVSAVSIEKIGRAPNADEEGILLRWLSPGGDDFSGVRVVRSTIGFPKNPLDGKVIYEGADGQVSDVLLSPKKRVYFYTIFVKTKDGRYSSGAVVTSKDLFDGSAHPEKTSQFSGSFPKIVRLNAEDFFVTLYDKDGGEQTQPLSRGHFVLDAGDTITLSAPYEKFPEILKTIVVHIVPSEMSSSVIPNAQGPSKNTTSFLLSVNADSTAYEATFLAPSEGGRYDVEVQILDYQNDTLQNIVEWEALEVQTLKVKFENVLKIAKSQFINAEKAIVLAILTVLIFIALAFRKIVRFS